MTTFVNFFCQSCLQPLKVDSTLLDLNALDFEEVTSPITSAIEARFVTQAQPTSTQRVFGQVQPPQPSIQAPKQKPSQLVITAIR